MSYNELLEKGFTRREAEVILMYNKGLREKELAKKLTVSRRTVEFHIKNILRKLGTRDRKMILWDGGVR